MTDEEYITKFIILHKELDDISPMLPLAIYNLAGKLVFFSMEYKKARGNSAALDDDGLPKDNVKYNKSQSIEEAENVVKFRKPSYSFNINILYETLQPYITLKFPIVNKFTDNVVATKTIIQKLFIPNFKFNILQSLGIYNSSIDTDLAKYKLTRREKQVIFFFLNGLNSQKIANILSKMDNRKISKSAIDAIFLNQLKPKFNSYTREGLYQTLLNLGFQQFIPVDLLLAIKVDIIEPSIF